MTSSSGSKAEDKITLQPLMLPRESRLTSGGISLQHKGQVAFEWAAARRDKQG